MHFEEALHFDRTFRFQTLQGTFRNQVVFGYKNINYRLTAENREHVCYQPEKEQVILSGKQGKKSTLTLTFPI